jgi:hypothetical protein
MMEVVDAEFFQKETVVSVPIKTRRCNHTCLNDTMEAKEMQERRKKKKSSRRLLFQTPINQDSIPPTGSGLGAATLLGFKLRPDYKE